ncbi:MAG: sigma-54-dependent Fis family transcriptional regulator [Gammaproteobacteria bacterium]|nr:sigma-54-dependent Fis family transcriptional regulator [Gammaproteobacteria bacterium]
MAHILIIEDERVICTALRRFLERHCYQVAEADSLPNAERLYDLNGFDLIISDLRLPGPPGTEVMQRCDGVPVLIMTSYASVRSAVDAMRLGAVDYIPKPFNHAELLETVRRTLESTRRQPTASSPTRPVDDLPPGLIGECSSMRQMFKHLRKIAPTQSTVLILGESGTGKELVANAVHDLSDRRSKPLVVVNCAAIPESLIEAELFGYENSVLRSVSGSHRGLLQSANEGTLFLDEIGELPLAAQARLLRLLQGGETYRRGFAQVARVDVRLIAATHQDLAQRVQRGLFRSDLYYRLRVMEISLPPLRERGEDLFLLARFLLNKICQRLKRPPAVFTQSALDALRAYPWPGNVRELENTVERAVVLSESETITPDLLALAPSGLEAGSVAEPVETSPSMADMSLDEYFRHFVLSNQDQITETEIARRLGISRKSLWEKRQRLGIPKRRRHPPSVDP